MKPVSDPAILAQLNGAPADATADGTAPDTEQVNSVAPLKAVRDPAVLGSLNFGLDFSGDPHATRSAISKLPVPAQKDAQDLWAAHRVRQLTAKGYDVRPILAQGIPILGNWLDEIAAGADAAINTVTNGRAGQPYDEALAYQRALSQAGDAAHPTEAAVGKLATGIVAGGPVFARLAPAATTAGRMAQGAAIAVPVGAADRFAAGEGGVGNRLDSALDTDHITQDAMIGGGLPIAGSLATRALGAAADTISPAITRRMFGPDAAAEEILARRIGNEGSSPAQKRLELQRGQTQAATLGSNSQATLPEAIADTSDSMQRLTGSLYRAGGEAGNYVKTRLDARQRGPENPFAPVDPAAPPDGQMARVLDDVERALQLRSSGTARQTETAIQQRQSAEGQRLYSQAFQNQDAFDIQPALDGLALTAQQYPAPFQSRLLRALNLFRDNSPQRMPVNNLQRFDASKKALDDMIEQAQRGGQNNLVRELTGFKSNLLNHVHAPDPTTGAPTLNTIYSDARNAWGSAAENRQAIQLGREALNQGSEIGIDQYQNLTRGQQQLFRLGFSETLRNMVGPKTAGNDITKLFQQRRIQELMSEMIPRSQRGGVFANRPERFGDLMNREARMVQTRNVALGGSPTARNHQDDLGFAGDALGSMWNRFRSSPSLFNIGIEAIGTGIQKIFGYRQDVALAMAQRLLETDPETRNQILRRLAARGGPNVFMRFADHIDRSGNAIAGAVPGALTDDQGGAR